MYTFVLFYITIYHQQSYSCHDTYVRSDLVMKSLNTLAVTAAPWKVGALRHLPALLCPTLQRPPRGQPPARGPRRFTLRSAARPERAPTARPVHAAGTGHPAPAAPVSKHTSIRSRQFQKPRSRVSRRHRGDEVKRTPTDPEPPRWTPPTEGRTRAEETMSTT